MAPTFRHGKATRVLVNQFDLSPFLNKAAFSSVTATADVTAFQQNDMAYIPGLREGTMAFEGMFSFSTGANSTAIDRILANYLGGSTQFITTVGLEGQSTGGWALMMKGDEMAHDVDAPVANRVSVAAQVQGSSFHFGGVLLRPLKAATATTANTGVVFAGSTTSAGSTAGGVGHFHMVAASSLTSLVAKVQHSTSGSTWVDLITFATVSSTAATFQRSTVSGTIKERTRANITTLTGGAGKSATVAIAFSRNGKAKG